jgi:hypothetical protein
MLEALVALERSYGFKIGSKNLSKGSRRPVQVQDWIKDGRGRNLAVRPIANLARYQEDWWAWWTELQPPWRGSWRGQTSEKSAVPADADWGKLVVPGQNGLLSVVATLYWWAVAEKKAGTLTPSVGWGEAVVDTTFVLRGLAK